MSNVFRNTTVKYFQVPQAVVSLNLLWDLSASAFRIYLRILHEGQLHSNAVVRLRNEQLRMSSQIVDKARRELHASSLIRFCRGSSGIYEYTICDPGTGRPLAGTSEQPTQVQSPRMETARIGRSASLKDVLEALPLAAKLGFYASRLSSEGRVRTAGGYMAMCPFHGDSVPSLKVDEDAGVWFCHGCKQSGGLVEFERLLKGSTKSAAAKSLVELLAPHATASHSSAEATYPYSDENGALLFEVRRYANKRFKIGHRNQQGRWVWNKNGVRDVPYRLHEMAAVKDVCVTEGEKDADRLTNALAPYEPKAVATTSAFGAGHWPTDFGRYFVGKDVMVLPDNDEPGLRHARAVIESVAPYANATKLVLLPDLAVGEDVSDYLDSHSIEELFAEMVKVPWTYPDEV